MRRALIRAHFTCAPAPPGERFRLRALELVILDLAVGKEPEFFTQGKVKKILARGL